MTPYDYLTPLAPAASLFAALLPVPALLGAVALIAFLVRPAVTRRNGRLSLTRSGRVGAMLAAPMLLMFGYLLTTPVALGGKIHVGVYIAMLVALFVSAGHVRPGPDRPLAKGSLQLVRMVLAAGVLAGSAAFLTSSYHGAARYAENRALGVTVRDRLVTMPEIGGILTEAAWSGAFVEPDRRAPFRDAWDLGTLGVAGRALWNLRHPEDAVRVTREEGEWSLTIITLLSGDVILPIYCQYRDGDLTRVTFMKTPEPNYLEDPRMSNVSDACPKTFEPSDPVTAERAEMMAYLAHQHALENLSGPE